MNFFWGLERSEAQQAISNNCEGLSEAPQAVSCSFEDLLQENAELRRERLEHLVLIQQFTTNSPRRERENLHQSLSRLNVSFDGSLRHSRCKSPFVKSPNRKSDRLSKSLNSPIGVSAQELRQRLRQLDQELAACKTQLLQILPLRKKLYDMKMKRDEAVQALLDYQNQCESLKSERDQKAEESNQLEGMLAELQQAFQDFQRQCADESKLFEGKTLIS